MASSMYQNTPPTGRPPQAPPPPPPGRYAPPMHHSYAPPHYPNLPAPPAGVPLPIPYNPNALTLPPPPLHHPGYPGQPLAPPPTHGLPSAPYPNPHYPAQHSSGNFASTSHQHPQPQLQQGLAHGLQAPQLGPAANRFNQVAQQPWGQKPPAGPGMTTSLPQVAPQSQGGFSNRTLQQGVAPQADYIPGRREETKDERKERKKREYYEKKRLEEKQQREKGGMRPGAGGTKASSISNGSWPERKATGATDKIENRLKRPSTFLCKIKFRNDLPECVSQPKLMRINTDKDQYTRYQLTSLEKSYKHKLLVEPDLGVPLDLLDISGYRKPAVSVPLHPEDAELLLDDEVVKKKEPEGIRKKERPTDKGVAWLVKTQYVSPLSLDPAKQAMTEKQAKDMREQREGRRIDVELGNDRDQQIQAIEESFKVSKLWPVHQSKPELEPVEILPLLPDFNRVGDQFVHMVFDTDPLTDAAGLAELDQEARYELEGRAIVKSFTIAGPDETRPERFVGYMVPKPEELERNFYDDEEDISFTWVREYHWDLRQEETATYVFCFGGDTVQYLPLSTKLILQKKKAKEGKSKYDTEDRDFPTPSSVTVQRRESTHEEEEVRDDARIRFMEGGATSDRTVRPKRHRSPDEAVPVSAKRREQQEDSSEEEDDASV